MINQVVPIPLGGVVLEGNLVVPDHAAGVVLFAHGSGSSRHSPRNRLVARNLQSAGLATLLIDLLTADEEASEAETGALRFDIGLLADRLIAVTDWLLANDHTRHLRIGYFGSSTGGGAALVAAALRADLIDAVVSRGGRPDLAGAALEHVRAPTLLIVGGRDTPVIHMNQAAMAALGGDKRLQIVPGATHLFSEPGALETVARLARDWFVAHLAPPAVRLPHGEPATPGR
jgi:putative phosphoribosyl transferase